MDGRDFGDNTLLWVIIIGVVLLVLFWLFSQQRACEKK